MARIQAISSVCVLMVIVVWAGFQLIPTTEILTRTKAVQAEPLKTEESSQKQIALRKLRKPPVSNPTTEESQVIQQVTIKNPPIRSESTPRTSNRSKPLNRCEMLYPVSPTTHPGSIQSTSDDPSANGKTSLVFASAAFPPVDIVLLNELPPACATDLPG